MITYYTKEGKFEANKGYIPYSKLHRVDGPAIEYSNDTKEWHQNGKCHRTDGPAVIWGNGDEEWWVNDKKLNTKKVETWINNNNINLKTKKHQVLFMVRFG